MIRSKKAVFLVALFVSTVFMAGCATTAAGTAKGIIYSVAKSVGKNSASLWGALAKLNNWIKAVL